MPDKDLTCRYCGRPIAVAMSTCPWPDCRETIMVICAACRAYTDNQGEFCEHCGEPLVAATFEEVELSVGTQALLVQLAQDQERARLVASGVIARYSGRFIGQGIAEEGVLADLLDVRLTAQSRATAVLFAAIAYLVQDRYCDLEPDLAVGPEYSWTEAREWDGQMDSLEARLAAQAWQMAPFGEAVRHTIAKETGLLLDAPEPDDSLGVDEQDTTLDDAPSRVPRALNRLLEGLPKRQERVQSIPPRPAVPAIVERGWEAVLPEHQEAAACDETRQLLVDFETADPLRAQYVLEQIRDVLHWFERVEQDPQTKPPGWDAVLAHVVEEESALEEHEAQVQTEGEDTRTDAEEGGANVGDDRTTTVDDSANIKDGDIATEVEVTKVEDDSAADDSASIGDDGARAGGDGPSPPIASVEDATDEDRL
jgi:hypothetical protein